jgi:hypothetical protein
MALLHIEYAVKKIMQDNGALAALVSTRIYPLNNVPRTQKLPYITYMRSSTEHYNHMQGSSGKEKANLDIDVWGETDLQVRQIGELVRLALSNYKGTVTLAGDTCVIDWIFYTGANDGIEIPPNATGQPVTRRNMEFDAVYNLPSTA